MRSMLIDDGSGDGIELSPAGQLFVPAHFLDVVAMGLELPVVEHNDLAELPWGSLTVEHPVLGVLAERVLLEVNRMVLHACLSSAT